MNNAQWFRLPMKLRQRWWAETDYGRREPSPELMREVAGFGKGDIPDRANVTGMDPNGIRNEVRAQDRKK